MHLVAEIKTGAVVAGPLPALGDDGAVVLRLGHAAGTHLLPDGFPEFQFVIGGLVDVNGVGAGAGLVAGAFQFGAPQAGFQVEPIGACRFDVITESVSVKP